MTIFSFLIQRGRLRLFNYFYILLYSYFSLINGQPREQQTCPTRCRCVHIEGRLTADCTGARMTSIPGLFPSGTMRVLFDHNPIGESKWLQEKEYFLKTDRYSVDWLELSLRNCNITAFNAGLFWGLPNLNKLILSRNKLTQIHTTTDSGKSGRDTYTPFKDMAKLRLLDLSHNQLSSLTSKNFDGALSLEDIDLSYNDIKYLHPDTFVNLPKLRTIDLTRNKLSTINRQTFSRLPHLKQLHLSANPFECDCRLKDFIEWQRDKYIVQPPRCVYPEKLRDKPWNHLKLEEFACAPKLTPGSGGKKIVVTSSGTSSMSLSCKVSGLPEPRVVWEFHNATQTVVIQTSPGKYDLKRTSLEGCPLNELVAGCTWLHVLRISAPGATDVGVYHCKATNPADTQYLVFQLDSDRGMIVQQVNTNGVSGRGSSSHVERVITSLNDDAKGDFMSTIMPVEKTQDTSLSGDILMVSLISGATILVIIALLLAVLCYRRAIHKNSTACNVQITGSSKAVNGYGYHIIDNGGVGATSPVSIGLGDGSAPISLRSPTSGNPAANPVEKPPRTHTENFYSETPKTATGICDYHRQQLEQRRRTLTQRPLLDDSRTGLIHAECDDSGFSDRESYYQQQRYATLPYQRNHESPSAPGSRTPGQRVLRPAIDDPLFDKKLLIMRRNSDGGNGHAGFCSGHEHSDGQRGNLSPFMTHGFDKAELRETAL